MTNIGAISITLAVTLAASTLGFFVVSFGQYLLDEFQIPNVKAGPYFLPFTIIRAASAPIFGCIIDKGYGGIALSVFGSVLGVFGLLMVGLSRSVEVLHNIYSFEILITIIGISSTATFVPLIPLLKKIYLKNDMVYMEAVNTFTSAMYCVCYGLGMVFGQSVIGGIVLQKFGFYISCILQAALCAISGLFAFIYLIRNGLLIS